MIPLSFLPEPLLHPESSLPPDKHCKSVSLDVTFTLMLKTLKKKLEIGKLVRFRRDTFPSFWELLSEIKK